MNFGVEIGEEILCETPEWERLHIPEGCILEVGLHGSSIDWASEGWFAILVSQVSGDSTSGLSVMGTCLGCEVPERTDQVVQYIEEGAVHLCPQDPCGAEDIYVIHATRVRCWTLDRFGADYISAAGKALLKKADAAAKRAAKAASAPAAAPRRKSALRSSEKRKASPPVIAIPSDEGEDGDEELTSDGHGKERHGELKALLTRTKERILGGGAGSPRAPPAEGAAGGVQAGDTASALAKKRLGAGTSLNPYRQTPLMDIDGGRPRGYKRYWYDTIGEEIELEERPGLSSAGTSRAGYFTRGQGSSRQEKGQGEGLAASSAGGTSEGKRGVQEKEKEEGSPPQAASRGGQSRPRSPRWLRLERVLQLKQPGRGPQEGQKRQRFGVKLRAPTAQARHARAGISNGDVGQACPATDGCAA